VPFNTNHKPPLVHAIVVLCTAYILPRLAISLKLENYFTMAFIIVPPKYCEHLMSFFANYIHMHLHTHYTHTHTDKHTPSCMLMKVLQAVTHVFISKLILCVTLCSNLRPCASSNNLLVKAGSKMVHQMRPIQIMHSEYVKLLTLIAFHYHQRIRMYRIAGFVCEVLNCVNYARGCELA